MELLGDITQRFAGSTWAHRPWLLAAVGWIGLVIASWRLPLQVRARWARPVMVAVILVSLAHAWHLRWVADDAFISFRYADNLVAGHGLVFNPGDRVEGYSNFLWTVLIAGGIAVGVHPVYTSLALSMAALAGTLVLVTRLAAKLLPERGPAVLPLGATLLGGNYVFACYGTSGLETMAGAFCVLLALERALAGATLVSGLLGILATMLHPDHAIFYVSLGLVVLLEPGRRREILRYALPLLVLYVPYFAWRWWYFGDPMPNTFYAKSGDLPYYTQGWKYLLISGVLAGLLFTLPLALVGLLRTQSRIFVRFCVISLVLYVHYVMRIGGDFMLGRLLIVAAPLVVLLAELGLQSFLARRRVGLALAGALPLSLMLVPNTVIGLYEKYWYVADEHDFYRLEQLVPPRVRGPHTWQAEALTHYFQDAGLSPKVGVGSVGIVGYTTGLPLIDLYGLTDREIAHKPLRTRGRPGHEKHASAGEVFQRGVQLTDAPMYPSPFRWPSRVVLHGMAFYLSHWDPDLVDALQGREGAEQVDFPEYLWWWAGRDHGATGYECGLWFAEEYYFSHNTDPELRASVLQRLALRYPEVSPLEPFLLAQPAADDPSWRALPIATFDGLQGWQREGPSARHQPHLGPVAGEDLVVGATGAYLDTSSAELGDAAVGLLRSPPFPIEGEAITLRVGGGWNDNKLTVRLLVDGETVHLATGCNSNLLGRRAWDVAELKGKQARLEIADRGRDPWEHLIVDEVMQWLRVDEATRQFDR